MPSAKIRDFVLVRGAGDLATGIIQCLVRSGFRVLACEIPRPSAIRTAVSLSTALYQESGRYQVEDLVGVFCQDWEEIETIWQEDPYQVPVIVDPHLDILQEGKPKVLVDAIIAKKNLGTSLEMAPWVIAVGPGFTAGEDCDVIVESKRGHDLGRLIFQGQAEINTGIPGNVGGESHRRVFHASQAGRVQPLKSIGQIAEQGEDVLQIIGPEKTVSMQAPFTGVIRGMILAGYEVREGFKIADIDPRIDYANKAFQISDKSRAIGGAVLTACMMGLVQAGVDESR